MAKTYEPIATYTVPSAQASYTFSSIPSTYTDLILIMNPIAASNNTITMRLNSDTASNYSFTNLGGDGISATSGRQSNLTWFYVGDISGTTIGTTGIQIQNYSNTTTFKTCLIRNNVSATSTSTTVGLWRKTPEAINSITLTTFSGINYSIGSTFTLYGIKAA